MSALTLFLAAVLALAAGHKLIARERLALITARLAHAPAGIGMPLLMGAAAVEGMAAIGLLIEPVRPLAAAGATLLWSVYAVALWRHLGKVMDCGCDLVAREKPVDLVAILRPAVLALFALAVAAMPRFDWALDAPFAAFALLSLWFAAGELAALPRFARTR